MMMFTLILRCVYIFLNNDFPYVSAKRTKTKKGWLTKEERRKEKRQEKAGQTAKHNEQRGKENKTEQNKTQQNKTKQIYLLTSVLEFLR